MTQGEVTKKQEEYKKWIVIVIFISIASVIIAWKCYGHYRKIQAFNKAPDVMSGLINVGREDAKLQEMQDNFMYQKKAPLRIQAQNQFMNLAFEALDNTNKQNRKKEREDNIIVL
jgi:hypothetical protein